MKNLEYEIECLRQEMYVTALRKGINHPDVIRISQRLDEVINEFYKLDLYKKAVGGTVDSAVNIFRSTLVNIRGALSAK